LSPALSLGLLCAAASLLLAPSVATPWSLKDAIAPASQEQPAPQPPSRLRPMDLAVVINTSDPLSVLIGNYYVRRRHIPKSNVVHVHFDYQRDELPVGDFTLLKANIDKQVPHQIQAFALTWARPYRVGCMSITAAFAFGFDEKYCASGCKYTWPDPYFNSSTARPYDDLHIRPTMSIAAIDFDRAQALIERGIRADRTEPHGTAYLLSTDDIPRDARAVEYAPAGPFARPRVEVEILHASGLKDRQDVLFYFIGASSVPTLETNLFLPGAIADHLTSFGGMLSDSPQMSSLRWLEAGATGSYGTVVEPCNILGKFPDVRMIFAHYLAGETLIEAYWKSVLMPGQGLFIGEPLAAPFSTQ
jgi:uncharacterized protein (TIGR03790 family)